MKYFTTWAKSQYRALLDVPDYVVQLYSQHFVLIKRKYYFRVTFKILMQVSQITFNYQACHFIVIIFY